MFVFKAWTSFPRTHLYTLQLLVICTEPQSSQYPTAFLYICSKYFDSANPMCLSSGCCPLGILGLSSSGLSTKSLSVAFNQLKLSLAMLQSPPLFFLVGSLAGTSHQRISYNKTCKFKIQSFLSSPTHHSIQETSLSSWYGWDKAHSKHSILSTDTNSVNETSTPPFIPSFSIA